MDRRQISFVKFILDGYDNVAVMSTVDPHRAVVQIAIAPGCETLVKNILAGLSQSSGVDLAEAAPPDGLSHADRNQSASGSD